ncbi:MAG: holin family protein [Smithella sp.]
MGSDITGIGSVFDFGSKVLDKIFPDKNEAEKAKLAMFQLQQQGELKELENEFAILAKQSEVNLEEAKSSNLFVSGWRPSVGWVCSSGLFYSALLQPILKAFGVNAPVTDTGVLIQMLFAMLGIAGMRSWEKSRGVAK